jgi:hypothetical protein
MIGKVNYKRTKKNKAYGGWAPLVCGMGERQKNEKENTINRICLALYQEPDTSEGLWRRTKIHKNTFLLRLKGLINNGLVNEHAPVNFSVRGKFFKHKFYLLEWNKT